MASRLLHLLGELFDKLVSFLLGHLGIGLPSFALCACLISVRKTYLYKVAHALDYCLGNDSVRLVILLLYLTASLGLAYRTLH